MHARSFTAALSCVLVCAVLGGCASGCSVGGAVGRSMASLFQSPRKVKKLADPIDHEARLAVLWVGHATALVQIDDKLILTDPVFTGSVGQLSRRLVEPGLDPEVLPHLDAVVISHMHFDHLSLGSLEMIEPKVRMLLMPRGGVTYLTDFSFPVLELSPWQAYEKDGLRITAAPVDHLAGRYGLDGTWAPDTFTGYVIEYHGMKVYFGGDTAYDQRHFVETSQRFPGLDVALLPIGPIEPRDFMRRVHLDPGEAIQAFIDLGAKHMVPIHYDTFVNSTDELGDSLRELETAKKRMVLGTKRDITTLGIGERHVFVKKGEGPSPDDDAAKAKDKDDGGWSTPASKPEAPAPSKPATKPAPKNDIPDDDKLD